MRTRIPTSRRLLQVLTVALLVQLSLSSQVRGEFLEPRILSNGGGQAIQSSLGVDLSFNAYIAWTAGDAMHLDIVGIQSSRQIVLSAPELGCGDPVVATNAVGTTFVAFTQDDPVHGGRDIFLVHNRAGTFTDGPPENLSRSPGDDYGPRIFLDLNGLPHLVWAQRLGNGSRIVYRGPQGDPVPVAAGDYPALAIGSDGTVHLVFTRGRDLFAINNRGGAFGRETTITRTPLDDEFFPSVAVADTGTVFVAYERREGLYYQESTDGGGRFGPPRLLDNDGVTAPELRVVGDLLTIVYQKGGDLFYILGQVGGVLNDPLPILATQDQVETNPSLAVDARGILHTSFIREGQVLYTNNAGQLNAEFSADVTMGETPLTVRFKDLSGGAIEQWRWDFGDGSPPSRERNPVHVFEGPDKYTVTLEVLGTGTQALVEKKNYIFVLTPNNRVWIPDQVVLPGQQGLWYPVMALHKDPVQGFELVGTFDPNVLTLKDITYQMTALEPLMPEFFVPSFSNDPSHAYFYVGTIFDFEDPYDNQLLPPGNNQRLVHLIFDCSDDAPQGGTTVVEPRNRVGPGGTSHNVFAVSGRGVLPALDPSTTSILVVEFPPPPYFRRGDLDSNGVELTDAIALLGYLFLGAAEPACLDAADADDNGGVDIADSIGLLSFLFLGGAPPAVPFPNFGLDPTGDGMKACRRVGG